MLVLAAALATAACGSGGPPPADSRSGSLVPEDRLALPEYDLETFRAMLAELSAAGTPVLVNVWGSWCPPCELEAPHLAAAAREFEGEVQFIGVDILDSRTDARDFILEYDWPYPSVFDPVAAIRDGLGYTGQPITILYDATGEVAWEWAGVVSTDLLRRQIRRVI